MELQGAGAGDTDAMIGSRLRLRGLVALLAGRRTARRSLVALVALLATPLLTSAPASAIGQRGHVYSPGLSFGAPGKADGQFKHPAGIAVENTTGNFYVADVENNRVQEFEPKLDPEGKPTFVRELKVPYPLYVAVDNSTSSKSKGDVYVIGALSSEKKEAHPSEFRVYKFGPAGLITKLVKFKTKSPEFEVEFEGLDGIAVDASGSVWLDQGEEVFEFNDEEKNKAVGHQALLTNVKEKTETPREVEVRAGGLAVDSEGHLYAGIEEIEDLGASEYEEELTETINNEDVQDGLVEEGQFAVAAELDPATGHFEHAELDAEYTTAIAVNPASEPANEVSELNDTYITNVASVAGQDATTIAAFNPQHELIQRFTASGLQDGDGIAVNSKTGTVYVSDGAKDRVDIFELEPRGAPTVGDLSACTLGGGPGCPTSKNATTLRAQVDPEGVETHYHFEYAAGKGSCSSATPCTATPEQPSGEGLTGFAGSSAESPELPELPTGVYHYRIVAKNAEGEAKSPEATFTILAATGELPDHRSWELVSPANKEGAEAEAISEDGAPIEAAEDGDAIAYLTDGPIGDRVEGSRSPELTQDIATIGEHGWSSQDLTTANQLAVGVKPELDSEYRIFSSDLALALLEPYPGEPGHPFAEPPLSPPLDAAEKGHQEKTIYLRSTSAPLASDASEAERKDAEAASENGTDYLALVTPLNSPRKEPQQKESFEPFGGGEGYQHPEGVTLTGLATPDLSHVVFESYRAAPGIYELGPPGSCDSNEEPLCTGGDIQPISVLPGQVNPVPPNETYLGAPKQLATLGGGAEIGSADLRHAISENGTLVFWATEMAGKDRHLFVRDTETHETLQLDQLDGGSGTGGSDAEFQTASAEGSRVFFTDTQQLVRESKARASAPDLYVAELSGGTSPEDPLTYTLKDLTPEGTGGESAQVLVNEEKSGGVIGASKDGSYVYFVADGRLAPEAGLERRGECLPGAFARPDATCYLYVRHYEHGAWAATKLVAALSNQDQPDWDAEGQAGRLGYMTSRVSPEGTYLAFMSDRSLTGYDNIDQNEATGRHADEEVYLYHLGEGKEYGQLVCVSCNPSGERPEGVYDEGYNPHSAHPHASLVIDRLGIWAEKHETPDHWLAGDIPGWTPIASTGEALYQSRYLSSEGRLFFNSPEDLVPAAKSHAAKVYEYEPEGVGSCEAEGGCIGLISSGTDPHESAFIDASKYGEDVFFVTASKLVTQDTDESYDVYDARVCEPSRQCPSAPEEGKPPCQSERECKGESPPTSPFEGQASEAVSTAASVSAEHEVLGEKASQPPTQKTLTRAQKLAKALKACKRDRRKTKRLACERAARRAYGPSKAKNSSAKRRRR